MTAKRMSDDAPIEDRLRERGNDPMLAYHSEIPKMWLIEAADEIVRLRADVESLVAREQDD